MLSQNSDSVTKKGILVRFILYVCWIILYWTQSAFCQRVAESPFKVSFTQSAAVSDESGTPKNSETWYFPAEKFIDSSQVLTRVPKTQVNDSMRANPSYIFTSGDNVFQRKVKTRIDTFRLNWFSYYLYKLEEPVLYNYSLNKDVYRLTWIRSFHPPVVISLEKKGSKVRLFTKMLTKLPELPGHRYTSRNGTIHVADTSDRIPFKINTVRKLTKRDYQEFTHLISKLKALYISPLGFRNSIGTDGSEWILETHRSDGYYFFVRWSPTGDQPLRILGDYLLDLSDVKKEMRY
ncbi:hypothetical protein [Spirosoma flavum]|uniref:DUF3108 domain-containing protein n=1 Tax=Spirosoma flavum TaxID=2048557 RepID=A0ABW6APX0_9BACT